jgi:enoyl-[acyl-carrier protein] reductase I
MGLLTGKRALIIGFGGPTIPLLGISNRHAEGAELCFTFVGEALEKRVRPLAASPRYHLCGAM